jgi:hypothetical protein
MGLLAWIVVNKKDSLSPTYRTLITIMERHLVSYYLGIVLLLILGLVPLVLPEHQLHVAARTRSLLVLAATSLVAYQFLWSQGYIRW